MPDIKAVTAVHPAFVASLYTVSDFSDVFFWGNLFAAVKEVQIVIDHLHINKTEQKLGWPHRFTCHSFRHAFATHFYEDHQDLLTLKTFLGHRSINSTTVYVDLSNATFHQYASPIESLQVSYE